MTTRPAPATKHDHGPRDTQGDAKAIDAVALPSAATEWLAELESVRRYSSHTLAAYRRDLSQLIAGAGVKPLVTLTPHDLRRMLGQLHAAGASPRTLARVLSCWRSFYRWWSRRAGLAANPAEGLRAPKAPRALPKALSVEQTMALLDDSHLPAATDGAGHAVGLRDHAMFELMYSSGLRLTELTSLDTAYHRVDEYESSAWIDLAENEVHVLGKGGKRRIVPIGSQARQAIQRWLEARPLITLAANEPALFVGVRGRRMAPRTVQAQLKRWAQRAGTPAHVHPHVLRHSFASHMLQSAQDLRAVQEMLGHASISTTQIYTRLDFQHLAAAYDNAHPRAKRENPDTE